MPIYKRTTPKGSVSYQAKVRVKGCPPESATFERKTDAHDWARQREVEMRSDKYFPNNKAKRHTVSDLLKFYLNDLQGRNPRRYHDVKPLLDWWNVELGDMVLFQLDSVAILKCQQKLMARHSPRKDAEDKTCKLAPATVNRYTTALHTAFGFGKSPLKWIHINPVDEIKSLKEPPGRIRFLSYEEIDRLIDTCKASQSRYLLAIVIIGMATGARRGEIETIKWTAVNPECTLITLPKTKNGHVRSIHLTGIASTLVKRMRENKPSDQIFLFPSPYEPKRPINFNSSWLSSLKIAKITDFHFHDLRHTCASYLAMNGATLLEIAEALGHRDLQMVRRYAHLTQSHVSNVVEKMTGKVLGHVKI